MKIDHTRGGIPMKRVGGIFTSFLKKIAARKILLYSLTVVIIVLPVSLALVFASRSHTTVKAAMNMLE